MSYKLELTEEAEEQLILWGKSGAKKDLKKIAKLFEELKEHPTTGTGQIEQLTGNLSGSWSRQINKKDRIIYNVYKDIVTVEILSVRSHYREK
jgi:toxin YoeB